ncbi:hypothetical protein ACF3NR_11150 [Vaginella massiliensis]|uniref:hypothetical protein n=1 Tax=Vaginella massiliensis TaxID=1816680 RepID=UPI003752CD9C
MDFIKKAELFFIQLQYCLTIEPEPVVEHEKGLYSLMLKPDIFLKLINDFQIEYPFIPENKIIELKCLMSKENINTENALKIIENYKKQYWFFDTVTMFQPVTDKLIRTLKSIDSNISEKEINIELINFQKFLQRKREQIYSDLVNEIQALPPQQSTKPKPEPKETELSEKIKKHFGFFNGNCPRKHKQILNDTDFEKLIEWTIWYFENDFKVPEISEPIKVVNTNKTFVQLAFRYLFKELHKSIPYPETLFDFYRSAFNPYSEDKKRNFEAVRNNDEVKKLMQIANKS